MIEKKICTYRFEVMVHTYTTNLWSQKIIYNLQCTQIPDYTEYIKLVGVCVTLFCNL